MKKSNDNFWIVRITLLFIFSMAVSCHMNITVKQPSANDSLPSNNIRNYLVRVSSAITRHSLAGMKSADDWKLARPGRQQEMIRMLGLDNMPLEGRRSPLNVKITGVIQRKGYRIEKLYYESLPKLYVEANLYIPDSMTKPRPAILYLCGHARDMKVHYQPHPAKFASLGFVCLIVETIQYGEVWGEHWGCYANGWFHWYSRGYSPAGVEVWNAIRGLDLLSERPEVDKDKLGVTGISGGGAITWFTAAVDERVKAAAPVCGASTVEAQICTRTIDGHCDCMMPINTPGWDFQDIGALIAPRPLLIGQANRDGLNQIESVREICSGLKKIYALYGDSSRVSLVETPGGHSYHRISREAIFSFFLDHLMGKKISPEEAGDVDESPEALLTADQLRALVHGDPKDDITKTIQDSFIRLPSLPAIHSQQELMTYRDTVRNYLLKNTFAAFPDSSVALRPERVFRTLDDAAYGATIYRIETEQDWKLRLEIRWNNPADVKKPLMIVLRNPGEDRWASESFISGLSNKWNVAFFETRGTGESGWAPELQWHIRRASAWTGRTIASMRVYDVLRCLEFCRTLGGVNPDSLGIAARDEMGAVGLYAALLDGKCKALILKNLPDTQDKPSRPDGRGEAIEMLNCLRMTDVNQIPALLYPAEIVFMGSAPETYQWSQQAVGHCPSNSFRTVKSLEEFR